MAAGSSFYTPKFYTPSVIHLYTCSLCFIATARKDTFRHFRAPTASSFIDYITLHLRFLRTHKVQKYEVLTCKYPEWASATKIVPLVHEVSKQDLAYNERNEQAK